jgi:hypothetical protein
MILKDLANYLQTNQIGTVGTDLFMGELPLNPSNCLAVIYSSSPTPNFSLDLFEQNIEFWARNSSMAAGYEKLMAIQTLLHRANNYKLGDYHIYLSNCEGAIEDNDRDIDGRKLLRLVMRFIYRP